MWEVREETRDGGEKWREGRKDTYGRRAKERRDEGEERREEKRKGREECRKEERERMIMKERGRGKC